MKQSTRDILIFVFLLLVKLGTAARTGYDTWTVSHDLLNVILIDCVFLALWFTAAYGGASQQALAIRPFAALGAWLVYGTMVVIGWEAHHDATAFATRIAGGVALAFDTWDYIVAYAQRMRINRKADTFESFQEREDNKAMRSAYRKAARRDKRSEFQTAANKIAQRRIEEYATTYIAQLSDGITPNGYEVLTDNRIRCLDCGWESENAYASSAQAQPAYAGHTRSALHKAAIIRSLRVDVTPNG